MVTESIDVGIWGWVNLDRWMIDFIAEELVKQVTLVVYGRNDIDFGDIDIDADCRVNAGTKVVILNPGLQVTMISCPGLPVNRGRTATWLCYVNDSIF